MQLQENTLTLISEGRSIAGFAAHPAGAESLPAVVVIQEVFGLNENIRGICRRLAGEGYAALAVDLYSGGIKILCILQTLRAVLSSNTDNYATRHLRNALTYLGQQPYADANRLGAIGFCMGGNFALALANEDKRVKTIAPFYGLTPKPLKTNVSGLCPVVGSYPEKDFTAKQGLKLDADLALAHIPHDIKVYPDAKHSFMNDSQSSYNPNAATDAWQRTLAFFGEHL